MPGSNEYDLRYWMGRVADDLRLSELNIPGTHETCARDYGGPDFVCQSLTLAEQLDAGIRYVDIRCRHYQNAFPIHHSYTYEHLDFGPDVLNVCLQFLTDHPRECIVMSVRDEYNAAANTQTFQRTFDAYIHDSRQSWYLEDIIPTLGAVRGRIVLLRRFQADTDPLGIDVSGWPDNATFSINNNATLRIEDNYLVSTIWNINGKWNQANALLTEALGGASDCWYITFCSGAGGEFPITVAKGLAGITGVNDFLAAFVATVPVGRIGTIAMDFPEYPNNALIRSIASLNVLSPTVARQISCIRKHSHADPHHPIRWIGGVEIPSGEPFKMTQQDCIAAIDRGERFLVVGADGMTADVGVFVQHPPWSPQGVRYIATIADSSKADNLLSLPDCPEDPLDKRFPYS